VERPQCLPTNGTAYARIKSLPSHDRKTALLTSSAYMLSSGLMAGGRTSAEINTAGSFELFFHQCCKGPNSPVTSPALCSIGSEQVLRYSVIEPEMM